MLVMDYIDPFPFLQGPAVEGAVDLFDSNTKYTVINETLSGGLYLNTPNATLITCHSIYRDRGTPAPRPLEKQ